MANLHNTVASDFAWYYEFIAAHLHKWVDPLTQEQFWHNPFKYGNSVGHLTLHLTGNLNYYIGARVAATGYVRDRDREFTETRRLPKAEVLQHFDEAIEMVMRTVRAQSGEGWSTSYSAVGSGDVGSRFHMVLKCTAHLDHHLGQMIYLCFELERPRT